VAHRVTSLPRSNSAAFGVKPTWTLTDQNLWVNALEFWSITMYDKDGFQMANPINRFAIGDRNALKYNPDGSLDIYIQKASPGTDKESNWLPAGDGTLGVTMRLYAPKASVIEGRWAPPAVTRTVN
jgi:hypothetical protein